MEKYDPLLSMNLKEVFNNCDNLLLMSKMEKETRNQKEKKVKKNQVKENWELYTMEGCIFCEKAKQLLKNRKETNSNVKLKIEVGIDENGNEDRDLIIKMKQRGKSYYTTWPRIFLNDEFIGGYSDLEKLLKRMKKE
jgi:glutaredoxin